MKYREYENYLKKKKKTKSNSQIFSYLIIDNRDERSRVKTKASFVEGACLLSEKKGSRYLCLTILWLSIRTQSDK